MIEKPKVTGHSLRLLIFCTWLTDASIPPYVKFKVESKHEVIKFTIDTVTAQATFTLQAYKIPLHASFEVPYHREGE